MIKLWTKLVMLRVDLAKVKPETFGPLLLTKCQRMLRIISISSYPKFMNGRKKPKISLVKKQAQTTRKRRRTILSSISTTLRELISIQRLANTFKTPIL